MYGFYCIALIEYILTGKTSLDNTNLFNLNDYKKNDKIIHKQIFMADNYGRRNSSRI